MRLAGSDTVCTERKDLWVEIGRQKEDEFVEFMKVERPDLKVEINPDKHLNVYVPDLLINGILCDLKTQETPFFKSADPRFTVTFNHKDYVRYKEKYPEIYVVFWVNWKVTEKKIRGETYTVEPLVGVWACSMDTIERLTKQNAFRHQYLRRINDAVNAKESYLIDVRELKQIA